MKKKKKKKAIGRRRKRIEKKSFLKPYQLMKTFLVSFRSFLKTVKCIYIVSMKHALMPFLP